MFFFFFFFFDDANAPCELIQEVGPRQKSKQRRQRKISEDQYTYRLIEY